MESITAKLPGFLKLYFNVILSILNVIMNLMLFLVGG